MTRVITERDLERQVALIQLVGLSDPPELDGRRINRVTQPGDPRRSDPEFLDYLAATYRAYCYVDRELERAS